MGDLVSLHHGLVGEEGEEREGLLCCVVGSREGGGVRRGFDVGVRWGLIWGPCEGRVAAIFCARDMHTGGSGRQSARWSWTVRRENYVTHLFGPETSPFDSNSKSDLIHLQKFLILE